MKKYFKILFSVLFVIAVTGCDKDDDHLDLNSLQAPSNLGATFQITQDNSGMVTIIPTGEGAVLFEVDFGDGSPVAEEVKVGEKVTHVYEEGQYEVGITGINVNGKTATGIQPLTVSFLAPENLEVDIIRDPVDNYTISVAATAQNAAMYEVYFGEDEEEEPALLMPGETVSYTYSSIGTYSVRVVALSGGAATTEVVTEVMITDPLYLPIDFESSTLNYTFNNFGGGEGAGVPIIDNPDPSGINTSARVASYTKPAGSEVWAGTTIALDEPIDFSTNQYIAVDVWSPVAGADVIFKIENLGDANINVEAVATTTVENQWETLIFDMSGVDASQDYGRVVLFFNFGESGTGETYYFDNIRTTRLELVKLPLTFESETLAYNWGGFGGAGGSVIDNPDASGLNNSAKVSQITKSSGAETWAGISLNLDEPVDFTESTTISMKVWSPAAGVPILFKMENSASAPDANGNPSVVVEVIQNTTTSNEWEVMNFDLTSFEAFSSDIDYDRVIIFYDFGNPGTGATMYFDDIAVGESTGGGGATEPTAAAAAPTFDEANVISMFSDSYTNVPVDTWLTSWSAGLLEDVSLGGNEVKVYSNLNFVGIETTNPQIDAGDMTHFHVDFWTADLTEFRIKLVDFGPNGVYDGGGDDVEHEIVISNPAQGQWVRLDIPLEDFEGLTTRNNISQLIFSGNPSGEGTVYVDNILFHN
ncbi:hypothetical protein FHG64_08535 [Antarcticibacterium flavum]|uniref:PKD/Chitinase domain-containing protein n=1 Tax=Antarcticibacterium flavum TaxID=2058175 RepID=A0A5B7X1G3_9FLAO|nr:MULTISPECIES: hypothetical protein [Antarcticibacterium]MCM4161359.1 hypothetical protein [Antarcticibacterium sp. W02-3]QCY69434.1 hypothetical protein FHG64_08535 [Antarcticibacterium flavum]